jgi:hypothetical protein
MGFRLPTFNLNVNIWGAGSHVGNPADRTCVGNLSPGERRSMIGSSEDFANLAGLTPPMLGMVLMTQFMYLLVPKLTDIRSWDFSGGFDPCDCVEVPAGTGRYYMVTAVDDVGKGFANEHRFAVLLALTPAWMAFLNPWMVPPPPVPLP